MFIGEKKDELIIKIIMFLVAIIIMILSIIVLDVFSEGINEKNIY